MEYIRQCNIRDDFIAWDRFLYNHPGAHYFQTYGWLKSYEPMGFMSHVLVHETGGVITGGVAFLSVKIPLSPWQIVIIPHGPVPADPDSPSWLPLMKRLDEMCCRDGAIFAQIYPHELSEELSLLPRLEELGFHHSAVLTSHRFSSTPVTIDLVGKSEDDVLKSLRQNTRLHVRRSLKSGLILRTDLAHAHFDDIYDLFTENGRSMGYQPRPRRSFKATYDWFACDKQATFFQAWLDNTLVGAILLVFAGRSAYYVAGAVRRGFEKHCPAEFMHWHAIREALDRNLATYDFVNLPSAGVTQFKGGFRPTIRSWHAPRTKLYHPIVARLVGIADGQLRPLIRSLSRFRAK